MRPGVGQPFSVALPFLLLPLSGCGAINQMAANSVTSVMESTADVWASGEDPEFVCQSIPFALSTVEGLLTERPESERLLLNAVQGFTQYAYVCVETDAILLEEEDYERSREQLERALNLFLRAKRYGMRGLQLRYPGLEESLLVDPEGAVAATTLEDVPLLYWTAASWGAARHLSGRCGRRRSRHPAQDPPRAASGGDADGEGADGAG